MKLGATGALALAVIPTLACKGSPATSGGTGEESGASASSSTSAMTSTGAEGQEAGATTATTTGAETTTGSEDTGTTTGTIEESVRFVVLGDGGEGNDNQFQVANAVELVCAERGCEFALYLGDNFYDSGVDSSTDLQFTTKFEDPYADLDFPFYVTLGNHDYGGIIGGVFANEWGKADHQISYTDFSDKWTLPAKWYQFKWSHVRFLSVDSPRMMFDHETEAQRTWFSTATAGASEPWKIAFGHHPYISNGSHGNAGNYEGIVWPDSVSGGDVKDFMDQEMCFKVDVYFSGHDHTRQWLESQCGVEFIVSGAAAKVTDLSRRDDNQVHYEDDQEPGFMWVEIVGDTFTGAFYDFNGNLDFERSFQR